MHYARDLEEALFVQVTLASDRAVLETWIAGRRAYDRGVAEADRGAALTTVHKAGRRAGRPARYRSR
jgi:hypothetical protein